MNSFKEKTVHGILRYSGLNALARRRLDQAVYVLMYHSVSRAAPAGSAGMASAARELYPHITIDVAAFERQMALLRKNGHAFIQPRGLADAIAADLKKPTIVYFDDGYRDNLTVALPILERLGIPATVFAATGMISRTHMLWTIELRAIMKRMGIPQGQWNTNIDRLKSLSDADRAREMERVYGHATEEELRSLREIYLSWEEVAALAHRGVEVGSHAVSHRRLTELAQAELGREIADSKTEIERHIGQPVISFSYPHGRFDAQVEDAVIKAGYSCVTSIGRGLNRFSDLRQPPFFLRNIPVRAADSTVDLESKLYGVPFIKGA